jgi:hypothetical protein
MAPGFRRGGIWTPVSIGVTTFYEITIFDEVVKSQHNDGFVKSSRCKARKN